MPGDDKNKHGNNEVISSYPKESHDAASAYAHAQALIVIRK